jgi:hypothetical protein
MQGWGQFYEAVMCWPNIVAMEVAATFGYIFVLNNKTAVFLPNAALLLMEYYVPRTQRQTILYARLD